MAKKSEQPKPRAIPQRTCVACREKAGKRGLVRIVRSPDGVVVDPTGKRSGRGAYLHPERACWENALAARVLQRALRTGLSPDEIACLQAFADALPVDAAPVE